jgi:hypothetical protein
VVFQKKQGEKEIDPWTGERHGALEGFGSHAGRAALTMEHHFVKKIVFLANGARCDWALQVVHEMRRRADGVAKRDSAVRELSVRIEKLNCSLHRYVQPRPKKWPHHQWLHECQP